MKIALIKSLAPKDWWDKFSSWCVKIWTAVITVGITKDLSDWENRRIRLLNGISAMGFIILFFYCFIYFDELHRLTFWESFQGVVAMFIVLLFNYYHLYSAARHFFNIYNIACYSFFAISHGKVDAAEYILVASSIASMLFFKSKITVLVYFLLNTLAFAICKYSFTTMHPFLFMSNGENQFVINHVAMFVIIFFIVFYLKTEIERHERELESWNKLMEKEKIKSDNLLLNLLPFEIAEELKMKGSAKATFFDSVTVMFTDFHNFTQISQQMNPEELLEIINFYFSTFDSIISKYDLEKIKTIGDSYMCAGGLPKVNTTHPLDSMSAAIEIMNFVLTYNAERTALNLPYFDLRIGMHTGPVIAGIVGKKKFTYDIWGDTVNVASRMESCSEEGKINISGSLYEMVKNHFKFTYRGKIEAKHKGMIDMYFVNFN